MLNRRIMLGINALIIGASAYFAIFENMLGAGYLFTVFASLRFFSWLIVGIMPATWEIFHKIGRAVPLWVGAPYFLGIGLIAIYSGYIWSGLALFFAELIANIVYSSKKD